MHIMARFRGAAQAASGPFVLCLAFSLILSPGCARPQPVHQPEATSTANEQKLPFRPDIEQSSGYDGVDAASSSDPKLATGLPFRLGLRSRVLPSGTLLTVQLEDSLVSSQVHSGDAFPAFVAAPLTIDGDTVIGHGTAVTGRVESTQTQAERPGLVPGTGYFRLTLSAITIDGRQLALQTSSLFTRGSFLGANGPSRADGVRVQKGRRLTFRLTAPVSLDGPSAMASPPNLRPANE